MKKTINKRKEHNKEDRNKRKTKIRRRNIETNKQTKKQRKGKCRAKETEMGKNRQKDEATRNRITRNEEQIEVRNSEK